MQDRIKAELEESITVKNRVIDKLIPQIEDAAKLIIEALRGGNKILLFGNGGSAADAQHIAAELIGRYKKERKSLPAIALTTDTSILTSLTNDYEFEIVFARQIESLGRQGDVAVGISTSGNSPNVLKGLEKARELGCRTISILGCGGGSIAAVSELSIVVPCESTPRIQESHITIGHIICSLVEQEIFPE